MTDASLATSADYADALLVARRGKKWLFLLLMLMLLGQIALFFVARYTELIAPHVEATTRPASYEALNWLTNITTLASAVLPILLSLLLLLIVNIMLVGRLIGVSRVTSAFLWCLLLIVLMFPWQLFFKAGPRDVGIPGVPYSWDELVLYAKFPTADTRAAALKWARFFVWPLVALILLLMVQIKSNRGMKQALGEAPPDLSITT